jgi:hypothetical protein
MASASSGGSSTQNLLTRGLFTLVSVEVEPIREANTNVVVSINYTYGDSQTNIKGNCPLPNPDANFIPISTLTRGQVLDWLVEHCPESTSSLDSRLAGLTSHIANTKYIYEVPSRSSGGGSSSGGRK